MGDSPQLLALDIGAGTQDILLYQEGREEENNPQLVLPSPSKVWAKKLAASDVSTSQPGDSHFIWDHLYRHQMT